MGDQLRDALKSALHPVLHDLDVRITGLTAGDCHCNLIAEVSLDALAPIIAARLAEERAEVEALTDQFGDLRASLSAAECAADDARAAGYAEAVEALRDDELRERLAAIEHERWAHWQRWMHGACTTNADGTLTIPANLVERWERQIATPYAELSEREKGSDRDQVARYLPLITDYLATVGPGGQPEQKEITEGEGR